MKKPKGSSTFHRRGREAEFGPVNVHQTSDIETARSTIQTDNRDIWPIVVCVLISFPILVRKYGCRNKYR